MQKCGKPTLSVSKDGIQLVSITNHFKFQAPDGKQRYADALDAATEQGRSMTQKTQTTAASTTLMAAAMTNDR